MALTFSSTSRESAMHGIKALVYGRAGMGKTTLCGTAPAPLIISAEAGLLSLRGKEIPVIIVGDFQEVREALNWCRTEAAKHGVQTICLDSISEIAEKCLNAEKKKTKDPRQAYGETANIVIELVKEFRDLPNFNVLVTSKETIVTDPITGINQARPTAPGQQIGPALPYLFDEVFHASKGQGQDGKEFFYLRTSASQSADAKDRSGVLDEIEYPDFGNIIKKILA